MIERLIAEGRATRPKGNLLDLGPPPPRQPGERSLTDIVLEMRDEERF